MIIKNRHKYSSSIELLSAIFGSGKEFSFDRHLAKLASNRERERYRKLVYRMETDGLIQKKKERGKTSAFITEKGKKFLKLIRKSENSKLPQHCYALDISDDQTAPVIIVIFDVPEKERHKRKWLRAALLSLSFKMVQKSAWIGKVRIPHQFLDDLRCLNLDSCVEIFSVDKSGSLENIF